MNRISNGLTIAALLCSAATGSAAPPTQAATKVRVKAPAKVSDTVPEATKLSKNAVALLPIVISAQAGEREKAAAHTLANYLKHISGGEFKVETYSLPLTQTTPGIVIGLASRFASAPKELKTDDASTREDYLLRSHKLGVLLVGASEIALEHAVWDLLYRLGCRQFFPGEKWEVVPSTKNLHITVNAFEHPDYYARLIWPGWGILPENQADNAAWNARNRMGRGIELNSGHAYEGIIARNKAEFEAHPEYLTKPGSSKFCVSNPALQQLVIKDALAQFEKNPQLQSISLDPSDGGGWESDSCNDGTVYKSVTDRAITLANVVAEAVTKKYPNKFIGLYAYNEHSPPPSIAVHPRVVVSIATSFIRGGYTVNDLLRGWSEKTAQMGIREYYSVNVWDRDLPGAARGGNLSYLAKTIPDFYHKKARFLSSEAGDNWGPNGLGYYLASLLLWDTSRSADIEAIKSDFLQKAFGPAAEPMREFYQLMDASQKPLLSADLIGRMFRQLRAAFAKNPDARVSARLSDLALYVRYVELFGQYSQANGTARQTAFENMMRFAWRIRGTHMIHTLALWRDLPLRDKTISVPVGAGYAVAEPQNSWKSSEPFAPAEIQQFIAQGIAGNALLEFAPVQFSHDLVPATPLHLVTAKPGKFIMIRGSQDFYTWVEKAPSTIAFSATGGLIYTTVGDAKIELFPSAEAELKSVASAIVPPDKQPHEVKLQTTLPGLQRLNLSEHAAGTSVSWPEGTPLTVEASLTRPPLLTGGSYTMYFYVPKGTKVVGGYRNARAGKILDADGKLALALEAKGNPGYWSVPVSPGQDGKLWTFSGVSGPVMLMTVPPYLSRSAGELLLPSEVVAADAK